MKERERGIYEEKEQGDDRWIRIYGNIERKREGERERKKYGDREKSKESEYKWGRIKCIERAKKRERERLLPLE